MVWIAQWVVNDSGFADSVVTFVMHMTMNPQHWFMLQYLMLQIAIERAIQVATFINGVYRFG